MSDKSLYWVGADGFRVPTENNPEHEQWLKDQKTELLQKYTTADSSLQLATIPIAKAEPSNAVINKSRLDLYCRILKAGESLPPIIVEKTLNGEYKIVDGDHRYHAARQVGVNELSIFELVKSKKDDPEDHLKLPKHIRTRMDAVVSVLKDDERKPEYRGNPNPVAGHCYTASQALYHLIGGKDAGWTPQFVRHEGLPHWYLKHATGIIADSTAAQFKTPVPYENGIGKGWLTGDKPDKRTISILARIPQEFKKSEQPLEKMAFKDVKPGRLIAENPRNGNALLDYNHLLKPEQIKQGYQLRLHHEGGSFGLNVEVKHKGKSVGWIHGGAFPGESVNPEIVDLEPEHQGKGLGMAMYEALFAHAFHHLRVTRVAGDEHSSMASWVHKKLAAKHGLSYRPQPNIGTKPENAYHSKESWNAHKDGAYDRKFKPYKYALKSEFQDPNPKKAVVIVTVRPDASILFGRRRDSGKWCMPAGNINGGEHFHDAAVRELIEETGLAPRLLKELGAGNGGPDGSILIFVMKALVTGDPTSVNDPDHEFGEFRWVDGYQDLPPDVAANLHYPNDIALKLLGLQPVPQPASINAMVKGESRQYAYHVTLKEFLPSISQKGLLPEYHEHAGEPVIFVEPDEREAAIYHDPQGTTAMLRMPVDGFGSTKDGESVLHELVPGHKIEVRHGSGWVPLHKLHPPKVTNA